MWKQAKLFDPELTSFLSQVRARMYMYSIYPSTDWWWKLFLGQTTKVAVLLIDNQPYYKWKRKDKKKVKRKGKRHGHQKGQIPKN